jgi:RHS repeat-associated protein
MIHYQYGNHLDSASLELSDQGQIISYEEYFPYGDTSFMAGRNQKEVKLKEYRYTGKEKDDVTGLYYYGARYYASWLGRWMSADPLFRENASVYDRPKPRDKKEAEKAEAEYMQKLLTEGLNLYGYVKGNPVKFIDKEGHQLLIFLESPTPIFRPVIEVAPKVVETMGKSGFKTGPDMPPAILDPDFELKPDYKLEDKNKLKKDNQSRIENDDKQYKEVILDTSVLPGEKYKPFIHSDEKVVITNQVKIEVYQNYLLNLETGGEKYRAFGVSTLLIAGSLKCIEDDFNFIAIMKIRKALFEIRGSDMLQQGDEGDIIIAATALNSGRTLITGDKDIYNAVIKAGGSARYVESNPKKNKKNMMELGE